MSLVAAGYAAAAQGSALRIVVIKGEDAVNIIQQKTAVAPVVEVRDRNDLPVAGAAVTFSIGGGKAATFAGGLQTLTVTTNAAGQAVAAGLTPTAAGAIQINATAVFQGQTAAALITQTNVMTTAQAATAAGSTGSGASSGAAGGAGGGGGGISGQTLAIVGGAAAAVGAGVVLSSNSDPATAPSLTISQQPAGDGLAEVTAFTLSVQGGRLTVPGYTWDFGDGTTATGSSVTHTYGSAGTFRVNVRASSGSGEESAAASVNVASLSGTWRGRNDTNGINNSLVLTQQGATISGQWRIDFGPTVPATCVGCVPNSTQLIPITGSVVSPRAVTVTQNAECLRTYRGDIAGDLRSMNGSWMAANPSCIAIEGSQVTKAFDRQ